MTTDCILAIDAGTTGVTAVLVDHDGLVRARGYSEITQHYPQPGWVEHDATEIWQAVLLSAAESMLRAPQCRPVGIGLTNQRETCLFWDRRSGQPLHRAIVWQCKRSTAICEELRAAGLEADIRSKTGLRLDPYFSGSKALWLIREDAALRSRVVNAEVCFGTIDSWLAWQLSGGTSHVTDFTNASRTLAFDILKLEWDENLLGCFGLNRHVVPEVAPSGSVRCQTVACGAIPAALPLASLVGDQQAALFGQACFAPGLTKATYGTGCFILTATGDKPAFSQRGLVTTLAATAGGDGRRYALEGSIFIAGAALQWCRDNLGIVASSDEGARLAASVEDSGGVVFVPAFVGLGSPYWAPDVRGAIFGLTGATRPAHIVRAAIDSMVFQAQDVLDVMAEDTGIAISELRADGGAAANEGLMQLQSDLCGVPVSRPESVESTALGAAFLAGLALGFWQDEEEIASLRQESRRFQSSGRAPQSRAEHEHWRAAIAGLLAGRAQPDQGLRR